MTVRGRDPRARLWQAARMFTEWQTALLEEQRVATLGTLTASGAPHLVPVCYALDAGDIVIAHDEKPKAPGPLARIRNVERDPRATLLVQRYDDDWTRLAWVRLVGRAHVVEAGRMRPPALTALRRRYPQYREMDLEGRPLLVLVPARLVAWRWQNLEPGQSV